MVRYSQLNELYKFKEARKRAGMTQQELADKLHISFVNISQYENNKRNPKLNTIRRIAAALGVHESDLMGDYDLSNPDQPDIPGPSLADDIKEKKPVSEENGLDGVMQKLRPDLFEKLYRFLELAEDNPDSAERFLSFAVQELESSK